MIDGELMRDLLEERAALIEEGEKCSRALAQDKAARLYGFTSWTDWLRRGLGPRPPEGARP